jgi:hypothetical protein
VTDRLLEFLPPNKRTAEEFAAHFKARESVDGWKRGWALPCAGGSNAWIVLQDDCPPGLCQLSLVMGWDC